MSKYRRPFSLSLSPFNVSRRNSLTDAAAAANRRRLNSACYRRLRDRPVSSSLSKARMTKRLRQDSPNKAKAPSRRPARNVVACREAKRRIRSRNRNRRSKSVPSTRRPSKAACRQAGSVKQKVAEKKMTARAKSSTIVLPPDYRPSEDEPFMNERQRIYFRQKLVAWKDEIIRQTRETLVGLHEEFDPARRPRRPRHIRDRPRAGAARPRPPAQARSPRSTQRSPASRTARTATARRPASRSASSGSMPARSRRCRSRRRSATSAASASTARTERGRRTRSLHQISGRSIAVGLARRRRSASRRAPALARALLGELHQEPAQALEIAQAHLPLRAGDGDAALAQRLDRLRAQRRLGRIDAGPVGERHRYGEVERVLADLLE